MDDVQKNEDRTVSPVGLCIFGVGIFGSVQLNTTGVWFEPSKAQTSWEDLKNRPGPVKYNNSYR